MAVRIFETTDRLVVSKPGFNANDPNLPESAKLLDSNWNFSGVLIAAGTTYDPAPQEGSDPWGTKYMAGFDIPFPDPGYVPAAYVMCEHDIVGMGGTGIGIPGFQHSFPAGRGGWDASQAPIIHRNRIEMIRPRAANNNWRLRYPGALHYFVFGISQ